MSFFNFFKTQNNTPKEDDWLSLLPSDLAQLLLNEIKENPQASKDDEITDGYGEFGLEKTNPIPIYGIPSSEVYLRSLRTLNGEILRYRRNGGIEVENIYKPVDEYEIYNHLGDIIAYIYLSPYHWKTSTKTPLGFYKKGESRKSSIHKGVAPEVKQKSAYAEYQEKLLKQREQEIQEHQKLNYRTDWRGFKSVLDSKNIILLYHFTDRENLKSIKKHSALFSWDYCNRNNINIPIPGGNQLSRELDTNKGLQNYVRVSFTRNHPMMFVAPIRNRNNVILEIDPQIVFWKGAKFADKNATRNDVNIGATFADFNRIQFDLFKHPNHFNLSELEKPFFQAEILIPSKIPSHFIINLDKLIMQEEEGN